MGTGARLEETRDEDFGMEGDEMEKRGSSAGCAVSDRAWHVVSRSSVG